MWLPTPFFKKILATSLDISLKSPTLNWKKSRSRISSWTYSSYKQLFNLPSSSEKKGRNAIITLITYPAKRLKARRKHNKQLRKKILCNHFTGWPPRLGNTRMRDLPPTRGRKGFVHKVTLLSWSLGHLWLRKEIVVDTWEIQPTDCKGHGKNGNDHKFNKLLIVKQILLVSTVGNIERTVWIMKGMGRQTCGFQVLRLCRGRELTLPKQPRNHLSQHTKAKFKLTSVTLKFLLGRNLRIKCYV